MSGVSSIRFGALFLFVLLLMLSPLHAQTRVDTIRVEGNQRIPDGTVISLTGITPGQILSDSEINAALRAVLDSEFFETATIRPAGSGLVIDVVERPTISRINIEGNRRFDDSRLLPVVQSQPRQVYLPGQAEADAAAIAEVYARGARLAATVRPKIIRRSDNRVDLVFEVTEEVLIDPVGPPGFRLWVMVRPAP